MGENSRLSPAERPGISIITCTNRQDQLTNLFNNYRRQRYPKKELIIVVNHDKIKLGPYQQLANQYKDIKVYRLPERMTLGKCLNFAVKQTKYRYIAKFDDDDYYAPFYLADSLQAFNQSNADIVGKRAHFLYLQGSKMLILRFHTDENRFVSILPGATLVFKRKVFQKVQFSDQGKGEDDQFCIDSKAKGFKIFSGRKNNFIVIRRKNSQNHTWVISDKILLEQNIKLPHVRDFKKFVEKVPSSTAKPSSITANPSTITANPSTIKGLRVFSFRSP